MSVITTGAISISNLMMVNHSLQELNMSGNSIGDDGIYAIARELCNCKINKLYVEECGITVTGAKSLSVAVASYDTIKELWLKDNPIGVEGALLMVEAAVHNTSYLYVSIDGKYKSNRVKEMLFILEKRRRQEVGS